MLDVLKGVFYSLRGNLKGVLDTLKGMLRHKIRNRESRKWDRPLDNATGRSAQ